MSDNKQTKTIMQIKAVKPEPFHESYAVEMTTATKICSLIDKFFGAVFNDYYRCKLVPIANGLKPYELQLVFRPIAGAIDEPDDKGLIPGFVESDNVNTSSSNEIYRSLIRAGNKSRSMNKFTLSQNAAEALMYFVIPACIMNFKAFTENPSPMQYKKNYMIGERAVVENGNLIGYNGSVIETTVIHLDVDAVITAIKGNKVKDKDSNNYVDYMYSVRPRTEIYANNSMYPNGMIPVKSETILELVRLNVEDWNNFMTEINIARNVNPEVSQEFRFG